MLASREHEGKFYLCVRRGRLITQIEYSDGTKLEPVFSSYAKSRACADELNETWLEAYDATWDRDGKLFSDAPIEDIQKIQYGMIEVIEKHLK